MHTNRNLLHLAGRAAAFAFLFAGTVSATQAQQTASGSGIASPVLVAAGVAPASPASVDASALVTSGSSMSSSSDSLAGDPSSFRFASDASQPPPRRRYGRPNYSDSHTNPDGSSKFAFMAGAGLTSPVQDTGTYLTPGYVFQVGAGRNWSKKFGLMAQFDYDHFGFQGKTLANQQKLYNSYCTVSDQSLGLCSLITTLDGNSHVWSFTVDPTFTFMSGDSWGAYAVGGVGFYHKTANFFVPTTQEACSIYGCFDYAADETIDKYTSNAPGFNGGLGITYKPSRFAGERFYLEARYVFVDNSTKAASNTNLYPPNANQTYYIPVTVGLRF